MPKSNKAKPLVLITHYHLRRGGVTRVIQQQAEVLQTSGMYDVIVCSGMEPEVDLLCPHIIWENFKYSDDTDLDSNKLGHGNLIEKVVSECGRKPDILHAHNHSLGKSGYYLHFINWWVKSGRRALFQLHDFAEDGRPINHKLNSELLEHQSELSLYPTGEHIRYALLNNRDLDFLRNAGFQSKATSVLPNAVTVEGVGEYEEQKPQPFEPGTYITYPTRAIRRKNVGELLLFAKAFPEEQFHVTLSPQNPKEQKFYKPWTEFADHQNISNVLFEAGKKLEGSFFSYLHHAKSIITTSIAEGFGLAFLEPWSAGNVISGRDLNGITKDFKKRGLKLNQLYKKIVITDTYFDKKSLLERWENKAVQLVKSYYPKLSEAEVKSQIQPVITLLKAKSIFDFGWLDEEAQREVITQIEHDSKLKTHIRTHLNIPSAKPEEVIQKNRDVLRSHYNIDSYVTKLEKEYNALIEQKSTGNVRSISTEYVLKQFMNLENLSMLRL
jgi:hypothetical protein